MPQGVKVPACKACWVNDPDVQRSGSLLIRHRIDSTGSRAFKCTAGGGGVGGFARLCVWACVCVFGERKGSGISRHLQAFNLKGNLRLLLLMEAIKGHSKARRAHFPCK